MTSARPYVLAECTWKTVKGAAYDVAILPWGATEAHNYHLPHGTDNYESEGLAIEAARIAWDSGTRVIVLPTVPFGVNTGQLDVRLCINMNPSSQAALLADVVDSLEGHGVPRLVIFNGHGGNDFKAMIRELQPLTSVFLCTLNWWQILDAREYFDEPGDHAGELETSLMLHLTPELVAPLTEAGPGRERKSRVAGFREGWAWAPRAWARVTDDTGIGDPARATAQKGERFAADLTAKIAQFFTELAATDPAKLYE